MAFEFQSEPDFPARASNNVPGGGIAQYTAVVLDTAGGSDVNDCIQATSINAPIFGVNQDVGQAQLPGQSAQPVTAGESMRVRRRGVTRAVAGGVITRGQYVQVNASGQFVAITSLNPATTATDTYVVGVALTGAPTAGDIFSLDLMPSLTTLVTS